MDSYVSEHEDLRTPLLSLSVYDMSWLKLDQDLTKLRSTEFELAVAGSDKQLAAIFDLRPNTRLDAGLGMCRTIFICIILTGGALFFSKDTNELVIRPIEKMIEKVKRIAKNPLEAA